MTEYFDQQFDEYVCDGDSISATHSGFVLTATIHRDGHDNSAPDKQMDGFWPSLDPNDCGYIGKKSKTTLARHMKRANEVMALWRSGDLFYCGVSVTVSRHDVELVGEYEQALWGIEANWPATRGGRTNSYLADVANELAEEALHSACDKLSGLCDCEAA